MALQLVKPGDLPVATSVDTDAAVMVQNGDAVERATPQQVVDAGRPIASEVEAVTGTDNTKAMTPLTVRQAINADTSGAVVQAQEAADAASASALDAESAEEQTGLDAAATAADRVQTGLDATATAADRVQTGLDAASTAADAIATAADRVQTGLDATATGADAVATAADAAATAADRVQTGLDAASTAADVISADADATAAAASAASAAAAILPFSFDTRADLAAWVATPNVPEDGQTYAFDGRILRGATGATVLAGLPGLLPPDNVANADHLGLTVGTATDAEALINSIRINAWLALADGNVFDWRADDISIGETIRLGRHGNGVIGTSAGDVFGLPTSGALCRWRGADGGSMILCQNSDTTLDVDSTYCYGVTLDGRSLARFGYVWRGCRKPMADALHVTAIRNNSDSYAYLLTGVDNNTVGCVYGGKFGSLTADVTGSANGFLLTGPVSMSGTNVSFCQFDYCHVTCSNGFAFVFQKGDDCVFSQLAVSRAAGGAGGGLLFNSNIANQLFWVGNVIHNANLSKTDGADIVIEVADRGTMGNTLTYNGVDYTPTLTLSGGALRSDNKFTFLGQTDYAGGFTNRPTQSLFALPNVAISDTRILDWYSEGTSTPTLLVAGSETGITYSARSLNWTRIGNMCTVIGQVILSSKGAGSGAVTISGLPFTAATGATAGSLAVGYYAGLVSLTTPPLGFVQQGATNILLYKKGATSGVELAAADIANTFRVDFSLTYRCAE